MEAVEGYTLTAAADTECTNDKFTASVWIKGGIGNSQPLVRPNEWRALYSIAFNNLYVYIGDGACSTAQFEYSFGDGSSDDWSHFAWTYDGSQAGNSDKITIYIDGEESEQGVSGTIPSELTHGCGTAMYLNGPAAIDEAYYGCDVLDADDITEMYNGGEPTDSSGLFSDLRVWLRCGDAEGDDETILYNQGSAGNFTSSTVDSDDIVEDVP